LCEKIVPILEKKIEHVLVVLEEETPKKQIVSKIVEISEKIEIPECSHLDSWEDF
jgi:hypothetical protein